MAFQFPKEKEFIVGQSLHGETESNSFWMEMNNKIPTNPLCIRRLIDYTAHIMPLS